MKARGPDLDYYRELEELGRAGSQDVLGRTDVISARVGEAASQLAQTDPTDPMVVRLLSFVAAGDLPDIQVTQFESTLHGTVQLAEDAKGTGRVPCFYFTFNDFYRYPEIDGALVFSGGRPRLCLNTFGYRVVQLRASRLYRYLASIGMVTDPDSVEATGFAFLADTPINRREEAAVPSYVRVKYQRPELQTFRQFWVAPRSGSAWNHWAPMERRVS